MSLANLCPICGQPCNRSGAETCSRACAKVRRAQGSAYPFDRACSVCGVVYRVTYANRVCVTCSVECGRVSRADKLAATRRAPGTQGLGKFLRDLPEPLRRHLQRRTPAVTDPAWRGVWDHLRHKLPIPAAGVQSTLLEALVWAEVHGLAFVRDGAWVARRA